MAEEYMTVSDNTYVLSESDEEGVFYFYRKDNQVLGDVGRIPMDMYQAYVMQMMMSGRIPAEIMFKNVRFDRSKDDTIIRLVVFDPGKEEPEDVKCKQEEAQPENLQPEKSKRPSFWKRILKKIFGF